MTLTVVSGSTAVHMPSRLASNLQEIGRHWQDTAEYDSNNPRTEAILFLVERYVESHESDFTQVSGDDDGVPQYRYMGDTSGH